MDAILQALVTEGTVYCAQAGQAIVMQSSTEKLKVLHNVLCELEGTVRFSSESGGSAIVPGSEGALRDLSIAIAALNLEIKRRGTGPRLHQYNAVRQFVRAVGGSRHKADSIFANMFGAQSQSAFQ